MNIKQIFETANHEMADNISVSFTDDQFDVGKIIEQINAYRIRASALENELTNEIIYNLFVSLQLSLTGLYRHSFISTRCALELGVALFKFKDDNLSFLLWRENKEDISWSNFFDEDRGVFSNKYIKLFSKDSNFDQVRLRAKNLYRECSEYVHGKYGYIYLLGESKISYNNELCKKTLEICEESVKIMNSLLFIRFGNKSDQYYELFEKLRKEFEI